MMTVATWCVLGSLTLASCAGTAESSEEAEATLVVAEPEPEPEVIEAPRIPPNWDPTATPTYHCVNMANRDYSQGLDLTCYLGLD